MNNLLQVSRTEVWSYTDQESQLEKGTFDHVANLSVKFEVTVDIVSAKALYDSFSPGI